MRPTKRILSVLCVLAMLLAMLPTALAAPAGLPSDYWERAWGAYAAVVNGDDWDAIIRAGDAALDYFSQYPLNNDIADLMMKVRYKRLTERYYESIGDYDSAVENTLAVRELAEYLNSHGVDYFDVIVGCDAHLETMTPFTEVYAVSYTQESPYTTRAASNPGTLYGSVFQGALAGYRESSATFNGQASIISFYVELEDETAADFNYMLKNLKNGSRTIQINWNFLRQGDTARAIPQGTYDSNIQKTLNYLAGMKCPVLLRIGGEMNIWDTYPLTQQEFIDAYTYLAKKARAIAPNVELVWSPYCIGRWGEPIDDFYPGDDLVDWVGMSMYYNYDNATEGGISWFEYAHYCQFSDPVSNSQRVVNFARAHNKPVAVTEGGAHKSGSKGESYALTMNAKAFSTLNMVYPEIKSFVYFDTIVKDKGSDYSMTGRLLEVAKAAIAANPTLVSYNQKTPAGTYVPLADFQEEVSDQLLLGATGRTYANLDTKVTYALDGQVVAEPEGSPNQYALDVSLLTTGPHTLTVTFDDGNGYVREKVYRIRRNSDGVVYCAPDEAPFTDSSGHWADSYIKAVADTGLMNGVGGGAFSPQGNLSVSQVLTLAARIHAGDDSAIPSAEGSWYQKYVDYCLSNGIVSAGAFSDSDMGRNATRYEMIQILDRAVPQSRLAAKVELPDNYVPDVDAENPNYALVYRWYRSGVITGDTSHRYNGDSDITRAEVAAILCRLNGLM